MFIDVALEDRMQSLVCFWSKDSNEKDFSQKKRKLNEIVLTAVTPKTIIFALQFVCDHRVQLFRYIQFFHFLCMKNVEIQMRHLLLQYYYYLW